MTFVVTHKIELKRSPMKVLKREYSGKLYNLNISGFEKDTLKCTEEHPILVIKNLNDLSEPEWIDAKDIEIGDLVKVIYEDKESRFAKVENIETVITNETVYNLEVRKMTIAM